MNFITRNRMPSIISTLTRQNICQPTLPLSLLPGLLVARTLHNTSRTSKGWYITNKLSKIFPFNRKKSEKEKSLTIVHNESSNEESLKRMELTKSPEANEEKPKKRSMIELSIGASSIFDFEAFEESLKGKDGKKSVEYSEKGGKLLRPTEAKKKQYEHKYSTVDFRISPRKLRLIANQIAGKPLNEAIEQMEFSHKRASKKIMNSLITARDHAWRYKMMDPEEVYVEQAFVGKGLYKKRPSFRARGRFNILKIKRAHMKYILKVRKPEEDQGLAKKRQVNADRYKLRKNPWVPLVENKPIYNPSRFYNW